MGRGPDGGSGEDGEHAADILHFPDPRSGRCCRTMVFAGHRSEKQLGLRDAGGISPSPPRLLTIFTVIP